MTHARKVELLYRRAKGQGTRHRCFCQVLLQVTNSEENCSRENIVEFCHMHMYHKNVYFRCQNLIGHKGINGIVLCKIWRILWLIRC